MTSVEKLNDKKPLKSEKLKIIDHIGTYYATIDGSKIWKIEKWLFRLIEMCDGKKTFNQIAEHIAKIAKVPVEDIKPNLKDILDELEKEKFISYR